MSLGATWSPLDRNIERWRMIARQRNSVELARTELLSTLRSDVAERPYRQNLVDGEPAWVVHERAVMHAAMRSSTRAVRLPPQVTEAVAQVALRPAEWKRTRWLRDRWVLLLRASGQPLPVAGQFLTYTSTYGLEVSRAG